LNIRVLVINLLDSMQNI